MSLRALRFAFIFALGLPAHLPAQAFAGPPPGRPNAGRYAPVERQRAGAEPLQKWANSGYHYCDAKILGKLWHTSTFQAKKVAGRKMNRGDFTGVRRDIMSARKLAVRYPANACTYHEAGYTYADAEYLAGVWQVPVGQAKTTIRRKVLMGQHFRVRKLLDRRGTRGGAHHVPMQRGVAPAPAPAVRHFAARSGQTARKAFFGAGYGYCDAKALGAMWRSSPFMAKAMGGYVLLGGGQKTLQGSLHMSRKLAGRTRKGVCTFSEAGFSPNDAANLGRAWGVSPSQARARAEQKLLWGGERGLRSMLTQRHR